MPGALVDRPLFGEAARLHHVGLAVDSIQAVSPASVPVVEARQGVRLAFVQLHGLTVELLEPWGPASPIARSLREGVRLLHLCYEVPDLDEAVARSRTAGFHRLGPPVPSDVFGGRRVAWVFSRKLGLFELAEAASGPAL
jgi:methylmalonyl-CoA/ethylmalonyl-CoA epimerase